MEINTFSKRLVKPETNHRNDPTELTGKYLGAIERKEAMLTWCPLRNTCVINCVGNVMICFSPIHISETGRNTEDRDSFLKRTQEE